MPPRRPTPSCHYAFSRSLLSGQHLCWFAADNRSARPRSRSWPRPAPASDSTNIWRATARPSSPMRARWDSKASCQSARTPLTVQDARLTAQNEERGCTGREARGGRGLESAALVGGPEPDGAHFFQFTFFSLVSLMSLAVAAHAFGCGHWFVADAGTTGHYCAASDFFASCDCAPCSTRSSIPFL